MEGIGDEQVLQAIVAMTEDGVDNDALEFFEECWSAQDASLFFPDDVISPSLNNNTAYQKVAPPDYHSSIRQQHGIDDFNDDCNNGMQFRHVPFITPSLPDSPPDSSSEPYSPPSDSSTKLDSSLMNGNLPSVVTNINNDFSLPPGYGSEMFPLQHTPSPHPSPSPQRTPMRISPNINQMLSNPSHPRRTKTKAPQPTQSSLPGALPQINTQMLPGTAASYFEGSFNNNSNHQHKKRKHSPQSSLNPATINVQNLADILKKEPVKQEPGTFPSCAEQTMALQEMVDLQSELGRMDANCQLIKFQPFQQMKCKNLLDGNLSELPAPVYTVSPEKGFNFSTIDESFVCQKKNHFQVEISIQISGDPQFVRTSGGCIKVDKFYLHFHGIKADSPSTKIKIEQSQSDRSKKPFYPVLVDLPADQVTKVTVGRLHFSETTLNNMRKKGKPNPDQRYFMLVVELRAHCADNTSHLISSMVSEKIIVRASNPGQFESDMEYTWQKGQGLDVVYHSGRVGINTDNPDENLTVHGNIKLTGQIMQPSDLRAKENIMEMDSREQLEHVQRLRIYKYLYKGEFAEQAGLSEDELEDTGVLAQELREVLPDAVTETGDVILSDGNTIEKFLVVNKDRIYMENVGAVKELCKLTDNLENRIHELERVNKKLTTMRRCDSLKSTGSSKSFSSTTTVGSRYIAAKEPLKRRRSQAPVPPPQEDGICSNRFTQIVVTILVLVMALCVIAMVTLYILEKHEPPSASDSVATNVPQIIGTTSLVSTPTSITSGTTEFATKPPITTGVPSRKGSNVHPAETSSQPTSPNIAVTTTEKPVLMQLIPRKCLTEPCEKFCCTISNRYDENVPAYKASSVDGNFTVAKPEDSSYGYRVHINREHIPEKHAVNRKNKQDEKPTGPPQLGNKANLNQQMPGVQRNDTDHPNVIYRRRRGTKEGELSIQTIVIKAGSDFMDDFIVDRKYCKGKCNEGNFTYVIGVSQYMPQESLTLQLTTLQSLMIYYCGPGTGKQTDCPNDEPPSVEGKVKVGTVHEWKLPIGHKVHVSYKFRVAAKNTDSLCQSPARDIGSTFTEYTFEFLRDSC